MQGIAVFNYINDANVQRLIGDIHGGFRASTETFDAINNIINPSQATNLEGLWVTFINFWAQRMANRYRNYVNLRITQLLTPWTAMLNANPTPQQHAIATDAIADINLLAAQVPNLVFFNRAMLT
jgi:hypothetical protein